MTPTQPATRLEAAIHDYVVAVFREVLRVAAVIRRGLDADDIADDIVTEVLRQPEVVMANYPDPLRYARVRVRHAGITHDRRQRAQRGEGVRLHTDADGHVRPGRSYGSGNAVLSDGREVFSLVADDQSEFESAVDDRLVAAQQLRHCCQGLSPQAVYEWWLVDGCGFTVQEVAAKVGRRRETVSRRLNHTRRQIRQNHLAMLERQEAHG